MAGYIIQGKTQSGTMVDIPIVATYDTNGNKIVDTYITQDDTAESGKAGIVKLGSDTVQTVSAENVTATASRTYSVQLNSTGQAVVNVPWSDTRVTQAYCNTGDSYPLLMSGTSGITSETSRGASTATLNNKIYARPSTGSIYASDINVHSINVSSGSGIKFEENSNSHAILSVDGNIADGDSRLLYDDGILGHSIAFSGDRPPFTNVAANTAINFTTKNSGVYLCQFNGTSAATLTAGSNTITIRGLFFIVVDSTTAFISIYTFNSNGAQVSTANSTGSGIGTIKCSNAWRYAKIVEV